MQHFYDGQLRRYLGQTIRALSNFVVKYGDGTLHRVPVMYGDPDKQAASILRQNSENAVNSVPKIAVYVSALALDRDRLADSTHVGKIHVRERAIDYTDPTNPVYTGAQGKNYTVERLMPTPFKLTLKADIWAANTDQKLQLLEQILVLFNPSLELQTSDNYVDWTSLTVLELDNISWSSRPVPVGTNDQIDVATLTLETPVWLSPPAKVKHLGVITNIITSIFESADQTWSNIDGLGSDVGGGTTVLTGNMLSRDYVTITEFNIQVYGGGDGRDNTLQGKAYLLGGSESVLPAGKTLDIPVRQGTVAINWEEVLSKYLGSYVPGSSKLYLPQSDGSEVAGTIAINPLNSEELIVNWDRDTISLADTLIDPAGLRLGDVGFDQNTARSKFDAIIDPTTKYADTIQGLTPGNRFLIIEDTTVNTEAWGNFVAHANDIIRWDGANWSVIFDSTSAQEADRITCQTNIYTGVQYKWNGVYWAKSFEGEYKAGTWRIEL
jgi:hypothetical protein